MLGGGLEGTHYARGASGSALPCRFHRLKIEKLAFRRTFSADCLRLCCTGGLVGRLGLAISKSPQMHPAPSGVTRLELGMVSIDPSDERLDLGIGHCVDNMGEGFTAQGGPHGLQRLNPGAFRL